MEDALQPYEILAVDAIGNPTFIDFISTKVKSDDKSVYEFLKTVYGFDENTVLVDKKGSLREFDGIHYKKLFQYYKGLKVEFAGITITHKDGYLRSINGYIAPTENMNLKPSISEKEALEFALKYINANEYIWQNKDFENSLRKEQQDPKATNYPIGELMIIDTEVSFAKPVVRLVYKFDIHTLSPLSREHYYVDSHTGEIIYRNPIMLHVLASGDTKYAGNQKFETQFFNGSYRLRDYTRGDGIETYDLNSGTNYLSDVDFTDINNSWTAAEYDNSAQDNAALDAHWGTGVTYDYFLQKHQRNSWNDDGGKLKSYVHYGLNYNNAFWAGNGKMVYGDGSIGGASAYTSIDIVAHEIGHGICEDEIGLPYEKQTGAINESLSDIWGAMVEYYATQNSSMPEPNETYNIGEDICLNTSSCTVLRTMSQTIYNTYKGPSWIDTDNCTPVGGLNGNDHCGVHTNSGVMNYWFYLLAEGGSGKNGLGNSYSIQGIGKEKAARIVYRGELIFNSNTGYELARIGMIRAAADIFGANSEEAKTVCKAWYAVGVGGNECSTRIVIGNGGFGNGSDPTNQPSGVDVICDRGNKTYSLLFVDPTANVVWTVSPNLEKMNETTLSLTVRGRRNSTLGHAYVIATVDGISYRQDIWIGEPQAIIWYDHQNPYQTIVYIEGLNGTDITKQGITNIDENFQANGNCNTSFLGINVGYTGVISSTCSDWNAYLEVGLTNACGTININKTISSTSSNGGGGTLPCYTIIDWYGYEVIVSCDWNGLNPFGRNQNQIQKIDIYNYMGVHYGTYENTNVIPTSKLPLGLYFIKGIDNEGNLFTLKYIK